MTTGDHVIFAGRVVASHINTEHTGRLYTIGPGWKMGGVRPFE
jgi:flavin reductase (DIM6/NTAB) family NADH-FMN oxidoreductase RutF